MCAYCCILIIVGSPSAGNLIKSSGYVLVAVPIPCSPPAYFSSLVAFGSDIYNIGGYIYEDHSSTFSILDCRFHTWHEAPSLRLELKKLSASVLDQNIYAAGCYLDGDSGNLKNSFEVFHTETQIWDPEPIACPETRSSFYDKSACIDGKFHVVTDDEVVSYNPNPKKGSWDLVGPGMSHFMISSCYCEIENVFYSSTHEVDNVLHGALRWYDTEASLWRSLKGLEGLPEFPPRACVRLADLSWNVVGFVGRDFSLKWRL